MKKLLLKAFLFLVAFSFIGVGVSAAPPLGYLLCIAAVAWYGFAIYAWLKPAATGPAERVRSFVGANKPLALVGPAMFLFASAFGLKIADEQREKREAAELEQKEADARRVQAVATRAKLDDELRQNAGSVRQKIEQALAEARSLFAKSEFEAALGTLDRAKTQATPYMELKPLPPEIVGVSTLLNDDYAKTENVVAARKAASELPAQLTDAKAHVAAKRLIEADAVLTVIASKVAELQPMAAMLGANLEPVQREAAALQKKIAPQVAKEKQAQERAAAQRAKESAAALALVATCGNAPTLSSWDGTYPAVKIYLKDKANDPDSIELAGCTPAVLTTTCWKTVCQYRGKNAFGAKILKSGIFFLGRDADVPALGRVLGAQL